MTGEYDAVLFDMDGVTVETADIWRRIEAEEVLPVATVGDVQPSFIRGLSIDDAYDRLVSAEDVSVTVDREGFQDLFDNWADEVYRDRADLLPGYLPLLNAIAESGAAIGLVSASRRDWVQMVLTRYNLQDKYDVVITASDISGASKPDPGIYREAASALGIEPDRCLAVEDSPHGIQAATDAGMHCIALRGKGNRTANLTDADQIVEDTGQLRQALLSQLSSSGAHERRHQS